MLTEHTFDLDTDPPASPSTGPGTGDFDGLWQRCTSLRPEALADVPSERLEDDLRGLAGRLAAATCAFLVLVGEYDARGAWSDWETLSCAHWLNWRCGIGMVAAREQVRVARRLRELPNLRDEFAAGRLSYSKVRAISRINDPAVVDQLIDLAASATAAQVERMVSVTRREERSGPGSGGAAAGSDEDRRLADDDRAARWLRSLTWQTDESGDLVLRARIPAGVDATRVLAAIDARTCRRPAEGEELEAIECRRLDALLDLVADATDRGVGSLSEQPEIVVHHHLDPATTCNDCDCADGDGSRGPTGTPGPPGPRWSWSTDDGWRLSSTAFNTLSCDAAVRAVAEVDGPTAPHPLGTAPRPPLDLGSPRARVPTPALRRHVFDRDGGCCRFPGCDRRSRLQVHHIVWWTCGGLTVAENLVLVCATHHRAVHERAWEMTGTADALVVRRPDGTVVSEEAPRLHGTVGEFWAAFDRHGPDVSLDGAGGRWHGEPIDWDCFAAGVLDRLGDPSAPDGCVEDDQAPATSSGSSEPTLDADPVSGP